MVDKSRIRQLINAVQDTDEFLFEVSTLHERMLIDSIRSAERRILDMMRDLETKDGKLLGTKINLKQAQANHKQLIKIMASEYGVALDSVMANFDEITKFIGRSWKGLGESVKFTGLDTDIIDVLKGQTYDQFEAFGSQAINRISEQMYRSVTAGAKMSELLTTVRGVLQGHKDVRGRPMTMYARQFANDSVMNFHNAVNLKKAEDLDINHYLYVGDIIRTTRPFCATRAGQVYTRAQIDSWVHDWQGKAGPAFEYRGGYNCRHHWRPIRPEWLPEGEIEVAQFELPARKGT